MRSSINSRLKNLLFTAAALLFVTATLPATAQNIPYQISTYTISQGVTFDVYLPNLPPPPPITTPPTPPTLPPYTSTNTPGRPVILLIHGGGWSAGSRADLAQLAEYYAGWGFVTVSTDYRLAPANPWPAPYYDVRSVVMAIKQNAAALHADPNRIAAIGFSAGGHLAALLGVTDPSDPSRVSRVNRIVTIAGPWDLTDPFINPGNYHNTDTYGMIFNLFGQNPNIPALPTPLNPAHNAQITQTRPASPIYNIDGNTPSTLIFHGDSDPLIPATQGQNACTMMIKIFKGNCTFVLMANTGHSLPSDPNVILNQLNPFLNSWALSGLK